MKFHVASTIAINVVTKYCVVKGADGYGLDRSQMSPPYRQSSCDDVLSPLSDEVNIFSTDNPSANYGSVHQSVGKCIS